MPAIESRRPSDQTARPALDVCRYVCEFPATVWSAANKLAWLWLWELSRGGRELVVVTPQEIGRAQGSQDGGRDRLRDLLKLGCCRSHPHPRKGFYKLEVLAGAALIGQMEGLRPASAAGEGERWLELRDEQGTFEPDGEDAAGEEHALRAFPGSSSAEPHGHPPPPAEDGQALVEPPETGEVPGTCPGRSPDERGTSPAGLRTSLKTLPPSASNSTSHFRHFPSALGESNHSQRQGSGTSPGTSPDYSEADFKRELAAKQAALAPRPVRELGSPVAPPAANMVELLVAARQSAALQMQRVNERIGVIERRVHDPKLYRSVAVDLAWACETHGLAWDGRDGVSGALNDLDRVAASGKLHGPRSSYFVGCAKKLLRRCGADSREELLALNVRFGDELDRLDTEALTALLSAAGIDPAIYSQGPHKHRLHLLRQIAKQHGGQPR